MKKEYSGNPWKKLICGAFLLTALLFSALQVQAKDYVVVLDPGHGGEGCATRTWDGREYREDILNLKIAQYAKAQLETYEGVKVYMTRYSNDVPYMDRKTRIKKAKSVNAIALVSIHLNDTVECPTSLSGAYAMVPTYAAYPETNTAARYSRKLGTAILNELGVQAGIKNNGYGYDDELGIILYGMQYKIPSLIVEHCFLSNPNDCRSYLSTEASLKAMGVADADGIAKVLNLSKAKPFTGWRTEGRYRTYYVNGVKVRNAWQNIGGKYYCFDKYGVLQTGVFQIGQVSYLSDENGVRQSGLVTYENRLYLASNNGKLYEGWRDIDGKRYYFSPRDHAACVGLTKVEDGWYYFAYRNAVMVTGPMKSSNGYYRYYDLKNGRMAQDTWVYYHQKWLYLEANGIACRNTKKVINGKEYIFNNQSICTNR